jgi:hypothetical protein
MQGKLTEDAVQLIAMYRELEGDNPLPVTTMVKPLLVMQGPIQEKQKILTK